MDTFLFYLFGALAVGGSLVVVAQRNPMYSVLSLIGSFIGLAGLYVLLDAPFTAVTQIIVYAGAIVVLFLFVVMLLNAPREEVPASEGRWPIPTGVRRVGLIFGVIFLAQLLWMVSRFGRTPIGEDADVVAYVSSVRNIGLELFTAHALAFEVTSLLILVAMVGAVVLAKRRL